MELQRLPIHDATHVARARRVGGRLALGALGETELDDLALVISELGSNILAHGSGGELLIGVEGSLAQGGVDPRGVEVLALDWGQGMEDVRVSLSDGVSQRPGLGGIGLGAVLRQSDKVELWSQSGLGSVIRARLGEPAAALAYTLAARHRHSCGDALAWEDTPWGRRVVAVDMAGQGAQTAALARELAQSVLGRWRLDPGRHLQELHLRMRDEGLRASAVVVDLDRSGRVRLSGTADHRVWVDGVPCTLSQGTLGIAVDAGVRELAWESSLALCSDGVSEVPTDGSPALRAARALWGAGGRDDLTVGVFQRM